MPTSTRLRALSFLMRLATWVLAVLVVMGSSPATSSLVRPRGGCDHGGERPWDSAICWIAERRPPMPMTRMQEGTQ